MSRLYARERKQFGKALGDDQKPAHVSNPDVSMRVSCAKLFCTEMAGRVADRGV
jgi:acyl-CoA dehydrogenase